MLTILTNGCIEEVVFEIKFLVEVGGRLLHRSQMPLLTNVNGADGYELVVPLLVKEEAKRANQQGLIFSRGFMPYRHHDIGTRYRIENAKYQKFIGFVSQLPELQNTTFFDGNSVDDEKIKFTCADCEDFAKSSGFVNSKQAGVAIIE
jgi:cytochrome oxidase assembly protein ShyY1